MKVYAVLFGVVLALTGGSVPLLAHHSFAAEYDTSKPIKVTGVVTKMEWMNPHARFYVDVKGADGKVTNWNFELGAIPVLLKQGWRKGSLKEGDMVTVEGYLAKDGSKLANARRVTLADGRKVFAGSAAAEGGPQHLVQHGTTGFIAKTDADFVQTVVGLAFRPERLQKLGQAARSCMLNTSWDTAFEMTYSAYRHCYETKQVPVAAKRKPALATTQAS